MGTSYPILPGKLPDKNPELKKLKPDFESLVYCGNSLFIIPSGSKPTRYTGVEVRLDGTGLPTSSKSFSLTVLFKSLMEELPELNIEGSIVSNDVLILFQRGNGKTPVNAMIILDLKLFLHEITTKGELTDKSIRDIKKIDLGYLQGTPLGFTDCCLYDSKIYFLAVAEASESTYEDGNIKGSVLGKLDTDGSFILSELEMISKPEGLCFLLNGNCFLVTDDDDAGKFSTVYKTEQEEIKGALVRHP